MHQFTNDTGSVAPRRPAPPRPHRHVTCESPFLFFFLYFIQDVHSKQAHSIVLVSTLDGHLRAIDVRDGRVKWTLEEGEPVSSPLYPVHSAPVLRTPNSVKQGFTFLPNPQDGTLYILKDGVLKKLPFTIPQLVSASPCRGSDGVLYAGSKKDVWFGIDPLSGSKVLSFLLFSLYFPLFQIETLSSATTERVCPANQGKSIFIGRTEYRVSMFDTENRGKTWNATFSDYSAHLLPGGPFLSSYNQPSSRQLLSPEALCVLLFRQCSSRGQRDW